MGEAENEPRDTQTERFSAMLGRSDELSEAVLAALGDSDFDPSPRGQASFAMSRLPPLRRRGRRGLRPQPSTGQFSSVLGLRILAGTDAKRAGYGNEQLQVAAAHSSVTTTEGYIRQYAELISTIVLALPTRG